MCLVASSFDYVSFNDSSDPLDMLGASNQVRCAQYARHAAWCRVVHRSRSLDASDQASEATSSKHLSSVTSAGNWLLIANIVTTSKALVTSSDALVPSSFLKRPHRCLALERILQSPQLASPHILLLGPLEANMQPPSQIKRTLRRILMYKLHSTWRSVFHQV